MMGILNRRHWTGFLCIMAFFIWLIPFCPAHAAENTDLPMAASEQTYFDEYGNALIYDLDTEGNISIIEIIVVGEELLIPETINGVFVKSVGMGEGCCVLNGDIKIPKLTINCHTVAPHAFEGLTIGTLTIGENVKDFSSVDIESNDYFNQFTASTIDTLIFNATELLVGRETPNNWNTTYGPFSEATIGNLEIGENVKVIPELLFIEANMTLDTLELQTERIGACAFNSSFINIDHLIMGENVKWFEESSNTSDFMPVWQQFTGANIGTYTFLANDLQLKHNGTKEEVDAIAFPFGPFAGCEIKKLEIGSEVTRLPELFLSNAAVTFDELTLTQTSIGGNAFNYVDVEILNIESDVLYLEESFYSTAEQPNWKQFYGAKIGQLNFNVSDIQLRTYSGTDVNSFDNVTGPFNYATLSKVMLGEEVENFSGWMFHGLTIPECEVYAVKGTDQYKQQSFEKFTFPICTDLTIHRESDFTPYFSKEVTTEQWLCEDFVETFYGESYLDEDSGVYKVDISKTCSVCGYEEQSEEILDETYDLYLSIPLEFDLSFDLESRSYIGSEPVYIYGRLGSLYAEIGCLVEKESDSYGKAIMDDKIFDVREYLNVNFDDQEIARFTSLQLQENAQMISENNLDNLYQYQMNVSVGMDAFIEGGIGSYQIMIPTRIERYKAY